MSDTDPNIRERLTEASKMKQEPKDRLWSVIFVLIVLVLLLGGITVAYAESQKNFLHDGRELGFQRGSVECLSVVVDNDRTFSLPSYCVKSEVFVYYPPEVCRKFFPDEKTCGDKWVTV